MSGIILSLQNGGLKDDISALIENDHISIDIAMLHEVSGNDMNFIRSTVLAFLKNMPETVNQIEKCINICDWDNVYKLAHSVKSSLSVIKINEMFDWITQIEANAKDRTNLNNMSDMIKKIKEIYKLAEATLNERFNNENETFQ